MIIKHQLTEEGFRPLPPGEWHEYQPPKANPFAPLAEAAAGLGHLTIVGFIVVIVVAVLGLIFR
jgi:hypothetical protein